jgi:hypothetical protein
MWYSLAQLVGVTRSVILLKSVALLRCMMVTPMKNSSGKKRTASDDTDSAARFRCRKKNRRTAGKIRIPVCLWAMARIVNNEPPMSETRLAVWAALR